MVSQVLAGGGKRAEGSSAMGRAMNSRLTLLLAFGTGVLLGAPLTGCGSKPTACGPATCASGCCDALGECKLGTESAACGHGGAACGICAVGSSCTAGVCDDGTGLGGGAGSTGGGAGSTGGGAATTGGGAATTGGGSGTDGGVTGGGAGGGAATCGINGTLAFSNGVAFVDGGTTVGAGNDITLTCFPSESRGDDLVYYFSLSTAGGFSADLTFDNTQGAFGGLALTQYGQCTPRSTAPADCQEPINENSSLTTTLPAGQYGLVVKSYPGTSGTFWLRVSTDAGTAGGGPGGGAGGGAGGGTGGAGGGASGWTCDPQYYNGDDGCDCGCGIIDPDCTSAAVSACEYCSSGGSCANDGSEFDCDTSLLTVGNNATCGGSGTGGGTGSGTCVSPDGVVISAVYSNGGNNNATYSYDYVELHNRASSAISLNGWTLQRGSGSGNGWTDKVNLGGSIAAGGYLLVRGKGGGNVNGIDLPVSFDIDASSSPLLDMGGSSGKLALVKNQTSLTGCPSQAGASQNVADFVAWGSASCTTLGSATSVPSASTALFRDDARCANTNDNSADFTVSSVSATAPRNSSSATNTCTCP